MAAGRKASRRGENDSIKFRWVPLDTPSLHLSDKQSQPKSPDILSTAQLVSAIAKVWDCANRPLPVFQPKPNVEHSQSFCQNENAPGYIGLERSKTSTIHFNDFRIHPMCAKHYYNMANASFEHIDIAQKTSPLELFNTLSSPFFQRYVHLDDSYRSVESCKVNGLASLGISFDFGKFYERISRKSSLEPKYPLHISQIECTKPGEIPSKTTLAVHSAVGCTDCSSNVPKVEDSQLGNIAESVQSLEKSVSSIQSSEYHTALQDLDNCAIRKGEDTLENENMLKTKERVLEDVPTKELCSGTRDNPKYALPNQRHALAGALSGTFVSLCLHPVDTIKTVTQSSSMAEKSIFQVVRSILSDRGVTGLYRGIASNIASSAPISAVYTYTYESVKGALLPLLPKECHSIAHCVAGGCASVATSFIFTPSERIKQQMQVGSHYQNSWAALVGIVGRGGLSSLYAGWGAVLCRNIPHSIIKFYTYETLKQMLLSSTQCNDRPSTYQTLICGGLAGCTAALFTTPFDVVKTRLQTQIPGSLGKYDGVFHALQEISKHEGLKGLYRGLTPRLVMYISQGALFFASYELFKSIFTLELPQICTPAPAIQDKQNIEGDSTSSMAPLSTSLTPRLHSSQSNLEPK